MNVALLSTGFMGNKEATAITLNDFAQELVKKGNKVTIISEKRKEDNRLEDIKGVQIYRIGFTKNKIRKFSLYNRILAHTLAIRKMQKKNIKNFQIIHSFSAAPIIALRSILAKIFNQRAKTIHTLKSYSRESMGTNFFRILNLTDMITVPTYVFAKKLISKGVKKNKIRVIHSHINTKKFYPQNKEQLKKKYGFSGKKIIIYYGSMWKNKGTEILIDSLPSVLDHNPDTMFIFAPRNVPYSDRYDIPLSKFREKVKIIKDKIKMENFVTMADLVVLPYPTLIGTEGNPSCMLEAMACKTSVVTTDLPELREIADGLVWMAKPNDINSLVATINHALDHPSMEMIENAYQKAQEFSVEKITDEFLEVYRKLQHK